MKDAPAKRIAGGALKPPKGERIRPTNAFYVVARFLVGVYLRVVYPVTVEGAEKLPWHKVLLCPNHSSNWDPLIIATRLPANYRLHAMAKKELFQNPVLGWILLKLGVFPVNREGADIKAVKTAIQTLQNGDNLLIFPEGTVIINGIGYADGLPAHAKTGAAMIGIRTGATFVPVFVDGRKRPFHRTRLIFGDPYVPKITGRKGTAEEVQRAADEILAAAYALGGLAVGGTRRLDELPAGEKPIPADTVDAPENPIPADAVDAPEKAVPADTVDAPEKAVPADTVDAPENPIPADTVDAPEGGPAP